MSISKFSTYINLLLSALKKLGGSARPSEVCTVIARDLTLSDSVLEERLKNGVSKFENRIHWARFYLVKTGYIDASKYGVWALTEKGRAAPSLTEADVRKLVQDVQLLSPRTSPIISATTTDSISSIKEGEEIPVTDLAEGSYREQLLTILKSLPPNGFERLCQRLLREAGFEEVTVTGRSGDGGIDGYGILPLNHFISVKVIFQCKRYEGSVGPSTIRDFRGAMDGRADKGIILTTGSFTREATREAIRDGAIPIELVDGEKLLDMFERLELGLTPRTTYDVNLEFFKPFRE
jgi:restriction system protein